jgi:uncharacterized RDD family membrane protein YckC
VQYEYWEDYEVLTVETPENLLLRLPLAGFGPRFLALLIDTLISGVVAIAVLVAIILLAMGLLSGIGSNNPGAMILIVVVVLVVSLLLSYGYFIIFETIWHGQTPGKRVAGIRVIKRGGQPLEFRDVLLRNILRIVDNLPTNYVAGLISFFASKYQQRLGDLVADTVVVREFTRQLPFNWAGAAQGQVAGGQLSPRHSYIMGSYLQRTHELPVEARLAVTTALITQLGYDPGPLALSEREAYLASLLHNVWEVAR